MKKLTKVVFTSLILLTGCTSKTPVLGIENGQLTPCPDKPNCVNSFSKSEAHAIAPIIIEGTKEVVKNVIVYVVNEFENAKVTVTENSYIRAEFTSTVFGFVDDVEFYFPETTSFETAPFETAPFETAPFETAPFETAPFETRVHVRSASRLGHSDFNVNKERVEQLRAKFYAFNNSIKP